MNTINDLFRLGAKAALYILAGLLPIWFLPVAIGVDLGREITFGILIVLAISLWLMTILVTGKIRYLYSPFLWGGLGVAVVYAVSTFLSKAPLYSALFADPTAEKFLSVAAMLLLAGITGSIVERRRDAGTLLFILIFSGAVSALLTGVQLLSGISLFHFLGVAGGIEANVIGTINGLSLFYTGLLVMSAGLVLSPRAQDWKPWVRVALALAAGLFLLDIILINFRTSWIVILGAAIFFLGLMLIENRTRDMGMEKERIPVQRFGWRYGAVAGLIALSVVMIIVHKPLVSTLVLTPEVSPSFSATLTTVKAVFKEGASKIFFGSGPGTFGLDWLRYKDSAINQTAFWGVQFNQGYSWAATLLATTGMIGFLGMLGLVIGGLFLFLRTLFSPGKQGGAAHLGDPFSMAALLGMVALIMTIFLYPSNFSLGLLLFSNLGVLAFLLARREPKPAGEVLMQEREESSFSEVSEADAVSNMPDGLWRQEAGGGSASLALRHDFWGIEEREISFTSSWGVFISSLAVIFLLALGVAGLYGEAARLGAAYAAGSGVAAANQGKIDESIAALGRASLWENNNFRTYQLLVAVRTEKIRALIQRAAGGVHVEQEFQSAVSAAVQDSQRALALNPADASLWRTQGALYELIIPFISGSERLAFTSYQKALELDPTNPAIYTDWGRAGLSFTDRIQFVMGQSKSDKERADLDVARRNSLADIVKVFQNAIALKADYAPAHFLLAQTQIRLGDADQAIKSVENARLVAPFDIGVAFQLGLLYYQRGEMDKAEQEFLRAISLNQDYSNARYFLGLIYDRKGDAANALDQFMKIQVLNPDNREVKAIIENLESGKRALDGIVPPAAPPEKRKDIPVKEEGTKAPKR